MNKTPRAAMRGAAQSTGHVDSPETIVIRRGRKSVVQPASKLANISSNSAYDDLPPTPTAPALMFVSPMTGERKRKSIVSMATTQAASPVLNDVRKLMNLSKNRKSMALKGVKELMVEPKSRKSVALGGLKQMMAVPR